MTKRYNHQTPNSPQRDGKVSPPISFDGEPTGQLIEQQKGDGNYIEEMARNSDRKTSTEPASYRQA
jgi:hypothetical protein